MSDKKEQEPSLHESNQKATHSLVHTGLWVVMLYIPTIILSVIFSAYAQQIHVVDPYEWFSDGDVVSVFAILMALFTLPVVAIATSREKDRWQYLALNKAFNFTQFRPWFLATIVFIALWWLINTLLGVDTPDSMLMMFNSTDYVLLSFFSICVVAPIFEEIVFRGFLFSRFRHSFLGNSGALIFTSIIFTLVHAQYAGIELVMIFSLAVLLAVTRIITGNIKYCIAIHAMNNLISMIALYS